MTRAELTSRILRSLNDSDTAPVFWTLSEIHAVIGEGQELLAEEVQALRQTAVVARRPGAVFYSLASIAGDIMAITRVWLPDIATRLEVTTMTSLGSRRWLEEPATHPVCWFPVGSHAFGIYPHPTQGQGLMHLDYLAWPATLLDDEDEPGTSAADDDSLVSYGIYLGLLKQWQPVQALEHWRQFLARFSDSQARHGTRELQARSWQRSARR